MQQKMQQLLKERRASEQGFTLVELAIVLVIIGLIVGGVLVGQDMIQSAEIRSTISQIEEFNTAKNIFKDKYGQLPGDGTRLADFGFTAGDGTNGHSDGNGRIEGCGVAATLLGCENALFWLNLSEANVVPFAPDFTVTGAADEDTVANGTEILSGYLPEISIGSGNFVHAHTLNGLNQYFISNITDASDMTAGANVGDAMSPIQAENFDRKIDDGRPNTGATIAVDTLNTANAADAGAAGDCAVGILRNSAFNTDEDNAGESETVACQMRVRMN